MSSYSRAGPIQLAELALVDDSASGNLTNGGVTTVVLGRGAFFPKFQGELGEVRFQARPSGSEPGSINVRNEATSNNRTYDLDWERVE